MSSITATQLPPARPAAAPPAPAPSQPRSLRRRVADFWLNALFWNATHCRPVARFFRGPTIFVCRRFSRHVRDALRANGPRILGPGATPAQIAAYERGVIGHFYDFVCDVGRAANLTAAQIRATIETIEGNDIYVAARAAGNGAIIVTAHMGSFEAGAAALLDHDARLHVVFKRDVIGRFEQVRSALRARLGVIEAPVDDGFAIWMNLRDALRRDEVVMIQGDRCMPGQKGAKVPLLHGHLMVPTGPVKLALATGAPIIPVFALRTPAGGVRIVTEQPIHVEPSDLSPHPALLRYVSLLEKHVRAHPDQWLLFHKAFCEDASG
jgi:KDO2-lipid IV(A) lauroyltransferase